MAAETFTLRRLTIPEFHAELKGQGVPSHEDFAFRCPMCGTVQSARSLIAAGAGASFDEVERFLGWSCVGRWTNAGPPAAKAAPGKGCDWTLGGLFRLHKLVVVDEKGGEHPRFEPATSAEALELIRNPFVAPEAAHGR